jgi:hypothetical protein
MLRLFKDMSIDELRVERQRWQDKIHQAERAGRPTAAFAQMRDACDAWIKRREGKDRGAGRRGS